MIRTSKQKRIHAGQDEMELLEEVRTLVETSTEHKTRPRLVGCNGETIELPDSLYNVLRAAIPILLEEQPVSIASEGQELTTQQAATLLNVSRQHLVNLLERGKIPFHKVGSHRRVLMRDVLAYRERRRAEQEEALDEVARLSFDEGMYSKQGKDQ